MIICYFTGEHIELLKKGQINFKGAHRKATKLRQGELPLTILAHPSPQEAGIFVFR